MKPLEECSADGRATLLGVEDCRSVGLRAPNVQLSRASRSPLYGVGGYLKV